jgi:hypothetical protein
MTQGCFVCKEWVFVDVDHSLQEHAMLVASKQKANDQLFSEMVSRARSSSVCLSPATP